MHARRPLHASVSTRAVGKSRGGAFPTRLPAGRMRRRYCRRWWPSGRRAIRDAPTPGCPEGGCPDVVRNHGGRARAAAGLPRGQLHQEICLLMVDPCRRATTPDAAKRAAVQAARRATSPNAGAQLGLAGDTIALMNAEQTGTPRPTLAASAPRRKSATRNGDGSASDRDGAAPRRGILELVRLGRPVVRR